MLIPLFRENLHARTTRSAEASVEREGPLSPETRQVWAPGVAGPEITALDVITKSAHVAISQHSTFTAAEYRQPVSSPRDPSSRPR
ncbi:MAG: hypothetical protein Q7U75_05500, partial [Desulfobacterales bacterium]|nr:hypothetical protein [Desulfobacterales bacterium]